MCNIEHKHNEKVHHHHHHTETKKVLNRLSKAIGHLESVKKMVETGRECDEVLIQLSAVNSAISQISKIILKDHIDHCLVDAFLNNDTGKIEDLKKAIDKMVK